MDHFVTLWPENGIMHAYCACGWSFRTVFGPQLAAVAGWHTLHGDTAAVA